jgi:hypothetical protein
MNESHPHMSTSAPLCAFEMYFFHPIDEPEVAVDVSGLFASSSSSSSAAPKAPPSALSSEESEGPTLCRPVPTLSLPDAKEAALSVVSSDEEDDEDENEDDAVSSTDYDFDDRENRPNAGRWGSALSLTTTNKRPVSQLDDSHVEGDAAGGALRRKQQRRCPGEEAPSREAIDNGDLRPHDDAQQRARVLLWKQSLKRSLFHPFVEQA